MNIFSVISLTLYHFMGITGQLVIDLQNTHESESVLFSEQNVNGTGTPTHPTKIISNGKLCDPNVQQHSGYINFEGSLGEKSYFFWLLESRSNPVTDPLVVWLSGGPGCSSQLALFAENGPCTVNEDGSDTIPNPYSWTNKANVIWVDQPAGTGFSSGVYDYGENGVQIDFYAFLQKFATIQEQFFVHHWRILCWSLCSCNLSSYL